MTRRRWIGLAAVGGGILIAVTVHVLVANRSTTWTNRYLGRLEGVMEHATAEVTAARIALWPGEVRLQNLRIAPRTAPDGDDPPVHAGRIAIDASWPATLWQRRLVIHSADFSDVAVRIARDADGLWNLSALLPSAPPSAPPTPPAAAPAPRPGVPADVALPLPDRAAAPPEPWPPVRIDRLRLDLTIRIEDAARSERPPIALTYALVLTVEGFSTVPDSEAGWAAIRLEGHLMDQPERARLTVSGRLAPVSDPDRLDFDLDGRLDGLDSDLLQRISGRDVAVETAAIDLAVSCRDGLLDPDRSRMTVRVQSLRLGDGWQRPLAGLRLSRAAVPVALAGPVARPRLGWDQALSEVLVAVGTEALEQGVDRWLRRQ